MNDKLRGILTGIAGIVNLGSIIALAGIGLKRNQDAYEAQMECIELELKNIAQDIEIHSLKREVAKLRGEDFKEEA